MRKLLILSTFILTSTISFSQKVKKDTLRTEEINVIKPYTPTIKEAFKVKSNPVIDQTNTISKEKVSYSIFSIPVASTFTPSKGKAKGVVRAPKEYIYENYISAGFGNYTSPLLEAYVHTGDPRYNDAGIFINHHSSQGGIKDLALDDRFSDTKIDLFYKQFDRDFNWQINAGVHHQLFNYYGLSSEVVFDESLINTINEKQVYKNIYAGGKIDFEDSFLKGATVELMNFSDDYNSNEFRFLIKPKIEFPISTELINTEFLVDLTSGTFKQDYLNTRELKYSFLNVGANPNFEVLRDDLKINLGAKVYFSSDIENKTSDFYAYPNITASYNLVNEVFIVVAGVTGDLIQNTYKEFANNNPYVSPTLNIAQTDKQYKAYLGAKGKLASNIKYNAVISHSNEKNKPLFIQNPTRTNGVTAVSEGYQLGNSFNVIYDNVKTLNFYGEITIEVSKKLTVDTTLNYANYTTENELEAWNLPSFTGTMSANYQYNNWFAGAKLFYNGVTKDYIITYIDATTNGSIIENDGYADLNLNAGYIFSDRLTAFARLNNALSKKYHPFVNYQVQTAQVLAGITYKFDL